MTKQLISLDDAFTHLALKQSSGKQTNWLRDNYQLFYLRHFQLLRVNIETEVGADIWAVITCFMYSSQLRFQAVPYLLY